jgi:hypothetical protein
MVGNFSKVSLFFVLNVYFLMKLAQSCAEGWSFHSTFRLCLWRKDEANVSCPLVVIFSLCLFLVFLKVSTEQWLHHRTTMTTLKTKMLILRLFAIIYIMREWLVCILFADPLNDCILVKTCSCLSWAA